MNRPLQILLPLAVLGLGLGARAWLLAHAPQAAERDAVPPPVPVQIVVAVPASHRLRVEAFGELRSPWELTLAAEVGGRLLWTAPSLEDGGVFAAGEELARLDPTDASQLLAAATAERDRAQAALEIERAQAASARADWESFGSGEPSPLALREPQLALAEAALAAAHARAASAATALERCSVRAPFAGRCDRRLVSPGAVLAPGAPIAQLRGGALEVRVVLTPADAAALGFDGPALPALAARVEPALGAAAPWPARLLRVEAALDPRDRTLGAILALDAVAPGARAGEFVRALLDGPERPGLVLLPRGARASDGRYWIVDAESRLRPSAAQTAAELAEGLLVSGFAGGERICVTPPPILVEGMPVAVTEPR